MLFVSYEICCEVTKCCWIFLGKFTFIFLMKNSHHETQRFIALCTKAKTCYSILSRNSLEWFPAHTIHFNVTSQSLPGFANDLLPRSFLTKILYAHLLSQFLGIFTTKLWNVTLSPVISVLIEQRDFWWIHFAKFHAWNFTKIWWHILVWVRSRQK